VYRGTTSVEHEMYNYSSNNWSHRIEIKGLKKIAQAIPYSVDLLQKTAICGTSHIMRKVLQFAT